MSKSLRSMEWPEKKKAITRRLSQNKVKGLGYWAAIDAGKKLLKG